MEPPVVAAVVLSCRDVIVHALTGLLCAARDAKDLAEHLLWITEMDDTHLRSMGERARLYMRQPFDECLFIDAYLGALDRLAARAVGRSRA